MSQAQGYVPGEADPRTAEMVAGTETRIGKLVVQAELAAGADLDTDVIDRAARDLGKVDVAALDQYTPQDVDSGAGTVNALPVVLKATAAGGADLGAAANPMRTDPTGTTAQPVTDNGSSLTVDGTVSAKDVWTTAIQADENANDSDKSFTVPASTIWQVLWVWVELASTATVGSRQMTLEIQDAAADVIAVIKAGTTQAASLTYNYLFAPSLPDLTAVRATNYMMTPMPPTIILPASYVLRVYDSAAVDAAADDMVVQLMVASRAA